MLLVSIIFSSALLSDQLGIFSVDDQQRNVYVDIPTTMERGGREVVRMKLPPPDGPTIVLDLISLQIPDPYDVPIHNIVVPPSQSVSGPMGPAYPAVAGQPQTSSMPSYSQQRKRKQPEETVNSNNGRSKRQKSAQMHTPQSSARRLPAETIDLTAEDSPDMP